MNIEKQPSDKTSWFDKLEPKEKLSQEEKSALADKLIPKFYLCFVIVSYWPYLNLRLHAMSNSPEVASFLSEFEVLVLPFFALITLAGVTMGQIFAYKAYGFSPFSGLYVLSDLRLKHWKPFLLVPIYALITEIFVRFYF